MPNVGKLLKPHPSAAAKNHWKHANRKLKEKDLNSAPTCFLHRESPHTTLKFEALTNKTM